MTTTDLPARRVAYLPGLQKYVPVLCAAIQDGFLANQPFKNAEHCSDLMSVILET